MLSGGDQRRNAMHSAVRRLVQRQLPQITQRLQGTLDKLNQPQGEAAESSSAHDWWREVQQRYGHEEDPV